MNNTFVIDFEITRDNVLNNKKATLTYTENVCLNGVKMENFGRNSKFLDILFAEKIL